LRNIFQLFNALLKYSRTIRDAPAMIVISVIAGTSAGFASTALIAVLNSVLNGGRAKGISHGWLFVGLCIVIPVTASISEVLLVRLTAHAAYELRLRISGKMLSAPYSLLEELGTHRLLAVITDDIPSVTTAITNLPLLISQIAILTGGFVYLGYLSWPMLVLLLVCMIAGMVLYQIPVRKSMQHFRKLREEWDATFKGIRALTEGTKELKLNRKRRSEFVAQQIEKPMLAVRQFYISGNSLASIANKAGQILFYVLIGCIVFWGPVFLHVSHATLTGYTVTVLFMIAPLTLILTAMPVFARGYIAAEKIESLGLSLDSHPPETLTTVAQPCASWNTLELVDVVRPYRHDGPVEEFCLGPMNLKFHRGELVFLIGGNGSGKTTLAKLLTGLYEPESGELLFDGVPVTLENRDEFRQNFSVVFYDFYLFEDLFGISNEEAASKGMEYIRRLQIDHKVQIRDGKLSTIELSQGQRKRLALLTAYLEDRPIYVFDEWASDQDPVFKEIFYHQILPELQARNKTIIVITHDDRYYHVANRIIKLERGQIEYDVQQSEPADVLTSISAATKAR